MTALHLLRTDHPNSVRASKTRRLVQLPPHVEGAKWIPLSDGSFALVDDPDYALLSLFNWSVSSFRYTKYAHFKRRVDGHVKAFLMHRIITGAPSGMQVDHINGNGLDCRRANMRLCSIRDNHRNIRKSHDARTSKYKGVSYDKSRSKWHCKIKVNQVTVNIGRFDDEQDAARAYDSAALKYFGEFARLNFP